MTSESREILVELHIDICWLTTQQCSEYPPFRQFYTCKAYWHFA